MNKRYIEECRSVCLWTRVWGFALSEYMQFVGSRLKEGLGDGENEWESMGGTRNGKKD